MKDYEVLSGSHACGKVHDGIFHKTGAGIAPLALEGGQDFATWVSNRAIYSSRGLTARNIKSASGLSPHTGAFETAMHLHAACITDNYWVRKCEEEISYEDIMLQSYDGFFGKLALGLEHSYQDYFSSSLNPELTNIGNSDKAWQIDQSGKRWLYKKQPLIECFHEILSAQIAARMNISSVSYELVYASEPDPELGRIGIVRSADFTQNTGCNLEHISGLVKDEHSLEEAAHVFERFGLINDYLNLMYFDILVGNPDRHTFNYGFMRDQKTGEVVSIAPNYDNNFAFMAVLPVESLVKIGARYDWKVPNIRLDGLEQEMRKITAFEHYDVKRCIGIVEENRLRVTSSAD